MATRILIVAEAQNDWRMVTRLIDRKVLHHAPDWLKADPDMIESLREWCGLEPKKSFTKVSQIKKIAIDEYKSALRGAGPIGFSTSGSGGYEKTTLRKILILCAVGSKPTPDVIIYSRDLDDQFRERKDSIEKEVAASPKLPFTVVLALANPEREAWILNGFMPKNHMEEKRLFDLRQELNFDPCEKAERLKSSRRGACSDAKHVLKRLTGGNCDRESECLEVEWGALRRRGKNTGLAEFLEQTKDRIVPLVIGRPLGVE